MIRPDIKFVNVGDDRVAYTVFGEGETVNLCLSPGVVSADSLWEHPGHLRMMRTWSDNFRCIMLDVRGSGVSDALPISQVGDIDLQISDILAVLNELDVAQCCVTAEYDATVVAINLALQHPNLISKLVLYNGFATGPLVEMGAEELDAFSTSIQTHWGSGSLVATTTPHYNDDMEFCARFERIGARPSAAAAYLRKTLSTDLSGLLPFVQVPTLVAYTGDISAASHDDAQDLVRAIPNARLFVGSSSSFYWGGGAAEETITFLTGATTAGEREIVTLLFTDIVNSTGSVVESGDAEWRQTLNFLDDLVATRLRNFEGRIVKQTGDGHLLEFRKTSDAIAAALSICAAAPTLGIEVRAGIHTGEIERREGGDIGGINVHVASRVASTANAGEVVVSRTVVDLVGAASYAFEDRGEHVLKGVPGSWHLFQVTERNVRDAKLLANHLTAANPDELTSFV